MPRDRSDSRSAVESTPGTGRITTAGVLLLKRHQASALAEP